MQYTPCVMPLFLCGKSASKMNATTFTAALCTTEYWQLKTCQWKLEILWGTNCHPGCWRMVSRHTITSNLRGLGCSRSPTAGLTIIAASCLLARTCQQHIGCRPLTTSWMLTRHTLASSAENWLPAARSELAANCTQHHKFSSKLAAGS